MERDEAVYGEIEGIVSNSIQVLPKAKGVFGGKLKPSYKAAIGTLTQEIYGLFEVRTKGYTDEIGELKRRAQESEKIQSERERAIGELRKQLEKTQSDYESRMSELGSGHDKETGILNTKIDELTQELESERGKATELEQESLNYASILEGVAEQIPKDILRGALEKPEEVEEAKGVEGAEYTGEGTEQQG